MIYQVDQSGKIEQTKVDTIIAMTNDENYVVVLKAKSKRLICVFVNRKETHLSTENRPT